MSHHLAKAYDVALGTRQLSALFHHLRFRLRKPPFAYAHADRRRKHDIKRGITLSQTCQLPEAVRIWASDDMSHNVVATRDGSLPLAVVLSPS